MEYSNSHKLPITNGRVNLLQEKEGLDMSKLFTMYDKIPANQCLTFRDPLIGIWDSTLLSKTFFSKENMQIIQNGIRAGVYEMSEKKNIIPEQDCDSLKIIMRGFFLQYAKNQPNNISQQVCELNQIVLDYSIPKVIGELESYQKYLNDVSTLVKPLARPIDTQDYTKRAYKMNTWFGSK